MTKYMPGLVDRNNIYSRQVDYANPEASPGDTFRERTLALPWYGQQSEMEEHE